MSNINSVRNLQILYFSKKNKKIKNLKNLKSGVVSAFIYTTTCSPLPPPSPQRLN